MISLKTTSKIGGLFLVSVMVLLSCKKDNNPPAEENVSAQPGCATNTGYFTIDVNGQHYELVRDAETHFTSLYGWFEPDKTDFVIYATDQNANPMQIELGLPGKFTLGTTTYTNDSFEDFFTMDVDTLNLYFSYVEFNVTTSNLDVNDGVYKPLKATYTGVAHSYPWINGQAPADTFNISGSFCLNGYIIP